MEKTTIDIIAFGMASRIVGNGHLSLPHVGDTDTLRKVLLERFPALAEVPYILAVNQEIISGNQSIPPGAEIAIMPPYSGG